MISVIPQRRFYIRLALFTSNALWARARARRPASGGHPRALTLSEWAVIMFVKLFAQSCDVTNGTRTASETQPNPTSERRGRRLSSLILVACE